MAVIERLFICVQKHSAEAIARYVGYKNRVPVSYQRNSCEVGADVVTWTNDRLFSYALPESYDPKFKGDFRRDNYPFVPDVWRRIVNTTEKGGQNEQLDVIRTLLREAKTVFNACDFDPNGQSIFDQIVEEFSIRVPTLRIPICGYDEDSIDRAFSRVTPNSQHAQLSRAAETRAKIDWLWGMNTSPLIAIAAREAGWYLKGVSAGRVVSPTLSLIVSRAKEIQNFTPITHYGIGLEVEGLAGRVLFSATIPSVGRGINKDGYLVDPDVAKAIVARIQPGRVVSVTDANITPHDVPPPLPYSLSSLQAAMNRLHGLTAIETASAARRLFDHFSAITYPYSKCRYYDRSDHAIAPSVFEGIAKNLPEIASLLAKTDLTCVSRAFSSRHVAIYPAIRPTRVLLAPDALNVTERLVYEEICRIYLAQFLPEQKTEHRIISLQIGDHTFVSDDVVSLQPGWRIIRTSDGSAAAKPSQALLCGERVVLRHCEAVELTTSPPAYFTDGTLVTAMNRIVDHISDPVVAELLSATASLGTEQSQAQTIEKLVTRAYVKRNKQGELVPTKLGLILYEDVLQYVDELRLPIFSILCERGVESIAYHGGNAEDIIVWNVRLLTEACEKLKSVNIRPDYESKKNAGRQAARQGYERGG